MIETMRSINFVKRITSFRCEGVDSKAIITGLERCVKEYGGQRYGRFMEGKREDQADDHRGDKAGDYKCRSIREC